MGQSVIADNWSLQDISNLLTFGVPQDQTAYLKAPSGQSHAEQPVSSAVIAFQALFDLLTDVVLCDQIIVDSGFTYAWDGHPVLAPLAKDRILKAQSFFHVEQQIATAREDLLSRLLTSDSLRAAHAENVASYQERRESKHVRLGSIAWGGAGMLAPAILGSSPAIRAGHSHRRRAAGGQDRDPAGKSCPKKRSSDCTPTMHTGT